MEKKSILVVDDEPEILRALKSGLTAQGFLIRTASNAQEALLEATSNVPDMVILDIMMPGELSGLDVCKQLRQWSEMPILILSAIGQERQKVAALDLGADDYLTKPFGMDELTARVRAMLRRYHATKPGMDSPKFTDGELTIDYSNRQVLLNLTEVKLTPIEYEILKYLTQNADRVITHRQILSNVWGAEYSDDTQLLRVHIGHLRQKISDDSSHVRKIINEPGIGYRYKTSS